MNKLFNITLVFTVLFLVTCAQPPQRVTWWHGEWVSIDKIEKPDEIPGPADFEAFRKLDSNKESTIAQSDIAEKIFLCKNYTGMDRNDILALLGKNEIRSTWLNIELKERTHIYTVSTASSYVSMKLEFDDRLKVARQLISGGE